jgi:hypothetical protein
MGNLRRETLRGTEKQRFVGTAIRRVTIAAIAKTLRQMVLK